MSESQPQFVGFTCAYTPLALMDAAGFVPYRILPMTEAPDQAGAVLHDNMCPHVKRILDRAMADDIPELQGVVIMESCDTMRRLADAWQRVRPRDRVVAVDLPIAADDISVAHFARQLAHLKQVLAQWSGAAITDDDIETSIRRYNELQAALGRLREQAVSGASACGWPDLQAAFNRSVTQPVDQTMRELTALNAAPKPAQSGSAVPVLVVGNVLPDPAGFELLVSSGARIIGDELCTSSRQIAPVPLQQQTDPLLQLATALLRRPPCARTLSVAGPGSFAEQVLQSARATGARGVIAHVMKFCDPYLGRLPDIREVLRNAGIPLLVLEGDCTLRSLGQHRTRIQAFVEMLAEEVQC